MKIQTKKTINVLKLCLAMILFTYTKSQAQFTSGNIVVLQVSDGSSALINTGNLIMMREFTPGGTPAYSVTVPSTTTGALIVSGAASSEGGLSLSTNNKYLVFGGYSQTLPNSTALAGSASSLIARGVGIIDAAGGYSLAATNPTFHSGNNLRSVASDGSNNYWSAGANDGTDYYGTASATTNIQNTNTNTRCINIFGSNLYFSTGSGTQGIYKVGSGLPVTSAQTTSAVITCTGTGSGSPSPYAFFFNPSLTVCYVADDRSISSGGGIQKWVYSSSTWSLAYTVGTGTGSTVGARGVIADFSGSNTVVYATTAESTNNRLISFVDAGSSSSVTTLATSTTNAIFRGLAFSPCNAPSITSLTASSNTLCSNQSLSLTVNATSSSSLTYLWSGAGSISASTSSNAVVTGAASGNYTVTVTNGCSSLSQTVAITVLPSPTLAINASTTTVCAGQTVALTASGANSYSWSGGITNGAAFNATATTIYTVTGTGTNNCANSSTINITANPLPALNVNSVTICNGQPATLTASGANSYLWNTSSTSPTLVVTPSVTTNYTITGTSSANCITTMSTQVVVTSSPSIVVASTAVCIGNSATLTAGGANTFTWSTGSNSISIVVSPATNTVYSVSGGLAGCPGVATGTAAVTVNPLPIISVSGPTAVCAGSSASQTASGATTYSLNGTNTAATFTVAPTTTSSFTVMGKDNNGCINSVVKSVAVNPLPTINIATTTSVICIGNSATLTANGGANYSWANGGGSNAFIAVSPTVTTTYTVTGTNNFSCSANAMFTQTVSLCTSVAESTGIKDEYNLYPNPATNFIAVDNLNGNNSEIKIMNALGAVVLIEKAYSSNNKIDVSNLVRGVYFVHINSDNKTTLKKLIVE